MPVFKLGNAETGRWPIPPAPEPGQGCNPDPVRLTVLSATTKANITVRLRSGNNTIPVAAGAGLVVDGVVVDEDYQELEIVSAAQDTVGSFTFHL